MSRWNEVGSAERLLPWQRRPQVGCRECDGPPDYICTAGIGDWRYRKSKRGDILRVDTPEVLVTRACSTHLDQIMDDLAGRSGLCSSVPLRVDWRSWLRATVGVTRLARWYRLRRTDTPVTL